MLRVFSEPVAFNTGWIACHESAPDMARMRAAIDVLLEFFESRKALFSAQIGS